MRATLVGRFFSGEKVTYEDRVRWGGYGHMGCCSLLAIQQVASVEPQSSTEMDYGFEPEQPDIGKGKCGSYDTLIDMLDFGPCLRRKEKPKWRKLSGSSTIRNVSELAVSVSCFQLQTTRSS